MVTQHRAPLEGGPPETALARPIALVQLIATAALALSTLVAVTAVSIGIARAGNVSAPVQSVFVQQR
jgi:hypothetical protein